jgi:hypothetical protein
MQVGTFVNITVLSGLSGTAVDHTPFPRRSTRPLKSAGIALREWQQSSMAF